MGINKKLKKGFDINLVGKALPEIVQVQCDSYALKPDEFASLAKPKVLVKEGDRVKAGEAIFFDKTMPSVMFTAPVSGVISGVVRGDKRKLLAITIAPDATIEYKDFGSCSTSDLAKMSKDDVVAKITQSGLWPSIIQRPFAIVAKPEDEPKAIYISGFESAPLAPDYKLLIDGNEEAFKTGIEVLKKLTTGKINLSVHSNKEIPSAYSKAAGIELHKFSGPHPAGNVGIQIHHISPINKGDVVWTINPTAVAQLGKLFSNGIYDASKLVALTGSEVKHPKYYKIFAGANAENILKDNLKSEAVRVISGNPLTGTKIDKDGYIGYYDQQLTVIPDGDDWRFLGSFAPSMERVTFSRSIGLLTFLNKYINPKKEYIIDANINGEHRNFVATGVLEKVLPMDIYPVHLLKAIMAEDFDNMEALGIYEVAEEDFALCEFVDVSKNDIQKILREGIDLMLNS